MNSVFDADHQSNTSLNSDNEESKLSVKSLSRAIESSKSASSSKLTKSKQRPAGAAIPAPTKPVAATIAHISVVNSSNNSNPALNKTASNDTIASSATATSTPAQTSLRIKGLRTITNNSAVKKSHNKENQVQLPHQHHELPKSIAMNKIYKSRDGLAAVSSNTSIMSELSNISKSSLPTSTLIRQASISSSTSSVKNNQPNSQTPSVGTKNSSHNPTSLLIRQQTFGGDLKQSMTANRLGSTSSVKQQQQNAAPIQARNSVVAAIASLQLHADPLRKASVHGELAKSSSSSNGGLRRPPGVTNSHPSSSSVSNAAVHETAAALQVITKVAAAVSNSSQSPSKAAAASSSAKPLSTEAKLGNEIKRLEALCESRTKELTMLKMRLRDTIFSFDGIVVAYNYLANHLNGFEASSLRVRLETTMRKNEELVRSLKSEIGEKDRALKQTQTNLANLTTEMNDMRAKLESQLAKQAEEYEIRRQLTVQEHELIVRDLKQERERDVKRLNKSIESLKLENEHQVGELREQLERKSAENAELDTRVREFEETLAKDKDERIQRMLDTQHNLEKEIESLKTALDIKNADLFDLRTKNNELTTKMENFNELNIKMRRYKQEIEQLNAVLKNKQEAERRTSEFNRQLAMKIEMKNRENQRLSMANEQLQFRLQSQPNLSQATSLNGAQAGGNGNSDLSFTSLNMSPCLNNNNYEDQQYQTPSLENEKNYASMVTSTSLLQKKRHDENNDESEMDFIDGGSSLDPSPAVVKLRSKSFKTPVGTSSSSATSSRNNNNNNNRNHNFHMQFRPVSESFDFNINERDMFMTRSAVMYGGDDDSLHMSDLNGGGQANVFDATGNIDVMVGDSIFGMRQRRHNDNDNDDDNSVNSSDHADITQVKSLPTSPNNSNSSEDNKSKDGQDGGKLQAKSAPCMPLKDEQEDQHHQSSLNSSSENNDTINMDQTTSLLDETEHDPKHAASSLNSSHADSDHSDSNSTPKKTTEEETMKEPGQHISSVSSSSVTSSSISAASTTTDGGSKLNATKNDDNNNSLSSSSLSFNDF